MAESVQDLPRDCLVYGAGGFGRRVAEALDAAGVKVRGFIDRSFGGGHEKQFTLTDARLAGADVVLGLSNPGSSLTEVAEHLSAAGVASVMSPVQVAQGLHARGIPLVNYWMTGDMSVYEANEGSISEARALLADERSRIVYDSVLKYRREGALKDSPKPDAFSELYAPADVPFLTEQMRVVDAGAFDGDSIRAMTSWPIRPDEVLALEPDPDNFDALVQTAATSPFGVVSLPLGVGGSNGIARFEASGSASASLNSSGAVSVPLVTLSDLCAGWLPTHVKMDIEGAEPDALLGASRLLRDLQPRLAVSAYHLPQHHWELLLLVRQINPSYRFFMRTYGEQTFDTVLYCIPE